MDWSVFLLVFGSKSVNTYRIDKRANHFEDGK